MREAILADGSTLYVHDEGDMFSGAVIRDGDYYEREILDYIADKYPEHEIILDIGANIGNHTTYFAKHLSYDEIIAFEPVLDNFILLRQNVKQFPRVTIRREAVGSERKMVHMTLNRDNMGAGEITPDGPEIVQQVRVDDLLIRKKVTLMKIDVEWYEREVIAGAKNIMEEDHPLILIEDVKEEYMGLLNNLGYRLEVVWPQHRTYLYA